MLSVGLASRVVQLKGDRDLAPYIKCFLWQEQVCRSQPGSVVVQNSPCSCREGCWWDLPAWLCCDQQCSGQALRVGVSPRRPRLCVLHFKVNLARSGVAIPDTHGGLRPCSSLNL